MLLGLDVHGFRESNSTLGRRLEVLFKTAFLRSRYEDVLGVDIFNDSFNL